MFVRSASFLKTGVGIGSAEGQNGVVYLLHTKNDV